jgi:hypothetical protein
MDSVLRAQVGRGRTCNVKRVVPLRALCCTELLLLVLFVLSAGSRLMAVS